MSIAQFLTTYLPSIYYYLIFSVILGTFFTIIKDRKLFPANSRGVLLLSSVIQVVLGSYLFIRSFGSGRSGGSGVVLPDGTFIADPQPILYAIDDILFHLLFPLTLFTVIATLYLIFTEIPKLKAERRTFDASGIILAGSLLFIFFLTGLYETAGYVSFIATMLLLVVVKYYKVFLYIIITMVSISLYFG